MDQGSRRTGPAYVQRGLNDRRAAALVQLSRIFGGLIVFGAAATAYGAGVILLAPGKWLAGLGGGAVGVGAVCVLLGISGRRRCRQFLSSLALNPYLPGAALGPRRPKLLIQIATFAFALALAGLRIWVVVNHSGSTMLYANDSQRDRLSVTTCSTNPPANASPAAVQYAQAANSELPGNIGLDATLAAEGNITHRYDFITEMRLEEDFLSAMHAISFPPQAQADATALMSTLDKRINFLGDSFGKPGYFRANYAQDLSLNSREEQETARLRHDLGLPAARCIFRAP